MTKHNRQERKAKGHVTLMSRSLMETDAWRALSSKAQALYVWLKLEWKGNNSNNNGKIRLSTRQAAEKMGIHRNSAGEAFRELQAKGFIVVLEYAVLGTSGEAKSPAFELTEIAMPHTSNSQGRMLYKDWQPGRDFAVIKANVNNPTGKGGKKKTQHNICDGVVIDFGTKENFASL